MYVYWKVNEQMQDESIVDMTCIGVGHYTKYVD